MEEKHLASGSDATEKLYYHDSHGREFTATVLSCEEKVTAKGKKEEYRVVLDRTLFFPEGGGQFGDQGWIDGIKVTDTHEKNGVIYHETEAQIAVGTEVKGELDYKERFSRMQQHTGEHMLSGIIHRLYGYDNVGFHLGAAETTMDFNGELTPEQVRLISEYADEVILSYDSDEAGQKATLRSLELFRNSPVKVGVLQIPGAKDPDEYIKKYGSERFKALLDGVGNALDFRLGRLKNKYDLKQDAQRLEYVKEAVNMLAERSNPTEQEVYAGRLAEETNISKNAIMTQLADAVKRSNSKRRWAQNQARLQSGEMHQISVPYSAGGSQALGVASAEQRLLAAMLREPSYIPQVRAQLSPEKFVLPQQKELYEAFLQCQEQGIEISLSTLRSFVSEEALNELSRLAAQYSDVNCTPDDIRLYLDRIARGTPVAGKAAEMSNDDLIRYLQSMREKKQGTDPADD